MNEPDNNDKAPMGVSGSFIIGAACAAFMLAIVISGVILPADSAPEKIGVISPIHARGESVFNGEGCASCHSRLVRKNDQGMGQALSSGEYSISSFSPGSSRLGPDLQNISGKFSRSFLETRLEDPSAIQPDTLMPSYSHLSDKARNALIAYLEQPISPPGIWQNIRTRNGIEPEVPDSILESLKK
ncbi:MAG: cbb3-type cytochrome c oxidase subunit II, partial [bacterium]